MCRDHIHVLISDQKPILLTVGYSKITLLLVDIVTETIGPSSNISDSSSRLAVGK